MLVLLLLYNALSSRECESLHNLCLFFFFLFVSSISCISCLSLSVCLSLALLCSIHTNAYQLQILWLVSTKNYTTRTCTISQQWFGWVFVCFAISKFWWFPIFGLEQAQTHTHSFPFDLICWHSPHHSFTDHRHRHLCFNFILHYNPNNTCRIA